MKQRCPICHKLIKASPQVQSEQGKFFPFCSDRCKLIDLGTWLDGEYKIISELRPEEESGEASDTSSDATTEKQ